MCSVEILKIKVYLQDVYKCEIYELIFEIIKIEINQSCEIECREKATKIKNVPLFFRFLR